VERAAGGARQWYAGTDRRGTLIEGCRAVTEATGSFVVVNPNAGLRRVLRLTGRYELSGIPDDAGVARAGSKDLAI
jgi:hypothetical protein